MSRIIRFGGQAAREPMAAVADNTLDPLLGRLSWKYVKKKAEFTPAGTRSDQSPNELKEHIAHWAGRVWIHANTVPTGAALRSFDLMSLEGQYRDYIETHGDGLFDEGLTVEEIWASQQLFSASPMAAIIAGACNDLLTPRMKPAVIQSSQAIVWTLAAMCFEVPELIAGGFNILVSDGQVGHTIYIRGLNGLDFDHPRGVPVPRGWLSFHDPWPARSLLAPENNFNGVQVLEDVTRPPMWLISPEDLAKVIVGYILPIDVLHAFLEIFKGLDRVEKDHVGSSQPLWNDPDAQDPKHPFETLFALHDGITPTTAAAALGLGNAYLIEGDIESGLECFDLACDLGLPDAVQLATDFLIAEGHTSLAQQWSLGRRESDLGV